MRVRLVHWNPRRLSRVRQRFVRHIPLGPRVNNFGDVLGPRLVERILASRGVKNFGRPNGRRLLSIGSVLHLARDGDVIWGTGVNGKIDSNAYRYGQLDVRAVRGPITRDFLDSLGIRAPAVYGDPGLLVSKFFPEFAATEGPRHDLTIVPNLNDMDWVAGRPEVLDPTDPLSKCLARIAQSSLVVSTSLHGIIVAESYGVPARLIRSRREDPRKYVDYYSGTGRDKVEVASSVEEAVSMGGVPGNVFDHWDPDPLLRKFPIDLWMNGGKRSEGERSPSEG